jgi:dipeptidyl aminopeptidase/acylaminoacyl peptidase
MRDALTARGVPVIYEAFEGEGHGFRKATTIRRMFETELAFYLDVFGLTA